MSQNGKGSKPRPFSVSKDEYDKNWERIFGREYNQETDQCLHSEELEEYLGNILAPYKGAVTYDEPKINCPNIPKNRFDRMLWCDERPPILEKGWAPGNYSARCRTCGETFTGDKRAWCCADCAYETKPSE